MPKILPVKFQLHLSPLKPNLLLGRTSNPLNPARITKTNKFRQRFQRRHSNWCPLTKIFWGECFEEDEDGVYFG